MLRPNVHERRLLFSCFPEFPAREIEVTRTAGMEVKLEQASFKACISPCDTVLAPLVQNPTGLKTWRRKARGFLPRAQLDRAIAALVERSSSES